MSRYIDADKIKEKLGAVRGGYSCFLEEERSRYEVLSSAIKLINEQPTADAVEVVRCKDCKYSSPNKVYGCRFEPFDTSENGERMYSDDFCSKGERADT